LKKLERENSEVKTIVNDQALGTRMLKDVNAKWVEPSARRAAADYLQESYPLSEEPACGPCTGP
jgi:hypothetical protein